MAMIRCPNCDTLHDLDDAFLASGRRKVRCASCRTVWEASESESPHDASVAPELAVPNLADAPVMAQAASENLATSEDQGVPEDVTLALAESGEAEAQPAAALGQDAIDAMEFGPEPGATGEDISADDLEALFAEESPAAPATDATMQNAAPEQGEDKAFDPVSLAMAQDAAAAVAAAQEAQPERRARRSRGAGEAVKAKTPPARGGMIAAMVMAASIGTLATLALLRQETVRLFPGAAPVFEAIGLSASARGLDITDVHSQMLNEDGRETLEVSGKIVNRANAPQKLPVLRLSIRSASGAEVYVWTATVDKAELAPGEEMPFQRRLASPPAESQSVMVRFVAKGDIVAAIR